jgi:hypothetical protein
MATPGSSAIKHFSTLKGLKPSNPFRVGVNLSEFTQGSAGRATLGWRLESFQDSGSLPPPPTVSFCPFPPVAGCFSAFFALFGVFLPPRVAGMEGLVEILEGLARFTEEPAKFLEGLAEFTEGLVKFLEEPAGRTEGLAALAAWLVEKLAWLAARTARPAAGLGRFHRLGTGRTAKSLASDGSFAFPAVKNLPLAAAL